MDLRLTFNEDPAYYDKFRPTYPKELTNRIIEFSGLTENMRALEVGIGTGQATHPFLETKCKIKAVELGSEMTKFVKNKYINYNNLDVVNHDFELIELDRDYFELVYSASAFHWIPVEIGLPKVLKILKSDGVFAWFSVQPMPADEHYHIHEGMQKIYKEYSQHFGDKVAMDPEKVKHQVILKKDKRLNTLREYGFKDVESGIFHGSRTFSSNDYVKLISTYSDHKAIPVVERNEFLSAIKTVIDNHGGKITMDDMFVLCMARK